MSEHKRPTPAINAVAAGAGALAVATGLASATLGIVNWASFHSFTGIDVPWAVLPISFGIVGALVASRHRDNATGWLFLIIAVVAGLKGVTDEYARAALVGHPSLPAGIWALWLDSWLTFLVFPAGALALLLLAFPDGHLASRRWRPVAAAAVLSAVLVTVSAAFTPGQLHINADFAALDNPVGIGAFNSLWILELVALFGSLVLLVMSAGSLLARMWGSRGTERLQLKWIAYAVIVSVIVNAASAIAQFVNPQLSWANDVATALGFGIAVPVASGIAIFKHRLYDIDLVISRTLVYGSLAVFITTVYIGIAVGIGTIVGSGGKPNLGLSIAATAIVAIGFQPVRERVQRLANRLVYGKRATPYEVLSEFSGRVGETYAADDVLQRMARVLKEGTGAESATVWLRDAEDFRSVATFPDGAEDAVAATRTGAVAPARQYAGSASVEVLHHGELLGALSVTKRRGESLTAIEQKLLDDLARQAGLVLKNVGLATDLQARLAELRSSRQRLVQAQDGERRRLERNLHDGAQQHVVALKVKLGLAEILMSRDPIRATATLEELKTDADEALENLRDLARGIYPPLLAEKGLGAALESQSRKATLPVVIDAAGIARYPQDLEAAVYFCVLEALQNVQKYARASQATVRISEADGQLHVDVEDDGAGFDIAASKRGAGLTNMEDRLDALGGTLSMRSSPGHGTKLAATLPVPVALPVA